MRYRVVRECLIDCEDLGSQSLEGAAKRLNPDLENFPHTPAGSSKVTQDRALALWQEIGGEHGVRDVLLDHPSDDIACYQGNIENIIGLLRMPIGLAGPLRVNGLSAKGDFHRVCVA